MRNLLLPLFLLVTLPSCCLNGVDVKMPNTRRCSPKDRILFGANCVDSLTGQTSEIDYDAVRATLEFEPQDSTHPGHPPGVFMSFADAEKEFQVADQMCRALGDHCTPETKQAIAGMKTLLDTAKAIK